MKNTDLFGSMYEQYYSMACRFARSYVRSDIAAEEIVSDSFFEWWKVMEKGDADTSPALLMTIVKHRCLNYLKREKIKAAVMGNISGAMIRHFRYRIMSLDACDPQALFAEDIRDIIERSLLELPLQTRRIFMLYRYEYLPVRQIAEKMNMTPKSVEYHIGKVLKKLHVALRDYLPLLAWLVG